MSLDFLRGAAAAFEEKPSKVNKPSLSRQPTKEELVSELTIALHEATMTRPPSRRCIRRSTTHVFDGIVSQLGSDVEDVVCPASGQLVEQSPWKRIDEIGDGLYICGAAALEETAYLEKLNIRSIVNCAERSLYTRTDFCSDGETLKQKLSNYRLEVLDAEDIETCLMGSAWEHAAAFIEDSLQYGGVVVHCAMGVSRSSSTCIAYLMLRRGMSLEAAFRQVFQARDHIMPNVGFWQQLQSLEHRLHGSHSTCRGMDAGQQDAAAQAMALLDLHAREKQEAEMAGW
eukprot:TRINITY_DN77071_c0_g1_i1.p1 TRINITY_DN77071_c0_g1~~TRINITY_DN77071_c0_g1_i1.p1  ORF type:complete len:295 (+),score=59.91 TRINITY_DN77071_c0_g1_i1:29-886(+)